MQQNTVNQNGTPECSAVLHVHMFGQHDKYPAVLV